LADTDRSECLSTQNFTEETSSKLFLLGKTTLANHTAKSQSTFASQTSTK